MKFLALTIFIFMGLHSVSWANKVQWSVKREIGQITIWNSTLSSKLRGTSQLNKKKSELSKLKERAELLQEIQQKKQQALSLMGVSDWKASKSYWQKNALIQEGDYIDKNQTKVYFEERHYFSDQRHIIILLTAESTPELERARASNFFETALKWENAK